MKFLTLDFETFYDKEYSLRKMTPAEYILDARYETICCAVQIDDGPVEFVDGPDFREWLDGFNPRDCITLTFNSLFDNCILAWRYGFVPARMVDGLGMARALLGHKLPSLSLEKVSEYLGTGQKGSTIKTVLGMHRADIIAAGLWPAFQQYAMSDVRLTRANFDILAPQFPKAEFRIMDLVLRCAVEPVFEADIPMLEQHLADIIAEKDAQMAAVGLSRTEEGRPPPELMSTTAFAELLEAAGVTVETKITATGNEIPALAKSDDFMAELLDHPDPYVQTLAAARLGAKSTLEESRARRLLAIAGLPWPNGKPLLPIPLRYAGAHTQRLSGDWKINMQNMPAGRGGKTNKLRQSLRAPPGHKVIVADLGQIEARLTAWFCRATDMLRVFAENKADKTKPDPYCVLATAIFGFVVTKANELERFVGKAGVLGLGFGLGADNFYIKTGAAARNQGLEMGDVWTQALALKTVNTYRRVNRPIPVMWEVLEQMLKHPWRGLSATTTLGPVEIGEGFVRGPGGLEMRYCPEPADQYGEIFYRYGNRLKKTYGAAFLENIIQFLARIVQMNAALRLDSLGYRMRHTVHDELIFVVPDAEVEHARAVIHTEMIRPPSWAPDIPLTADIGVGQTYGEAK
jgi:DNA polymerase